MTVGQFKKFISLFTLPNLKIKYFNSKDRYSNYAFINELDSEDVFDEYIVSSYTLFLEENSVFVFVRAV